MTNLSADLEIHVTTRSIGGGECLGYVLHSARGTVEYTHHRIDGEVIRRRPEDYQARLLSTLELLAKRRGSDGSLLNGGEVAQELEALGHELYQELFPRELRDAYRDFRDRVRTLLLVSDEPWIPWELVKPFEVRRGEVMVDDDFLCCRFELTRWLAGETSPTPELGAARVACIEAGKPPRAVPLAHAKDESRLLVELARNHSDVESLVVADATYDDVERVLRQGGNGILHFVGHGEYEPEEPDTSRFLLVDGRSWRPRDLLNAGTESRVQQDRPLVFFNSCQIAQQGYALTRLGGWASRWILDCGCGGFIAPQWSVGDAASCAFAKAFYKALEEDQTVGEAARTARRKLREELPDSPAWLAYTVYAHPNGRLRLGLGPTPLAIPEPRWRPGISPPGCLLRAEYGIVPFHGREREIEDFSKWCADDLSEWGTSGPSLPIKVRLYTGAGGMGKTRLAIELCKRQREEGWEAGFVFPDSSRNPEQMWQDLVARRKPALLVVDYAETRRPFLVPLLREMYRVEQGRVRLILLARAALDWWEQLKTEGDGVGELLSGPATSRHTLMPLAHSVEQRAESYRRAAEAFAESLGSPKPGEIPEDLGEPLYERVLLLHMRALAAVEGINVQGEDGVLDYVLNRERRFWSRLARERKLPETLAEGIGRAMAAITLGGGVEAEDKAVAALRELTFFEGQSRDVLVTVARLLHESYPGQRWIEPILPDLLAEHLVQREMERGADELLDLVLGSSHESS